MRIRPGSVQPAVAWTVLNLGLLAGGWSMTDPEFRKIIVKEDNVPIAFREFPWGDEISTVDGWGGQASTLACMVVAVGMI